MDNFYHIIIEKVNGETGERTVETDDNYKSVAMLAEGVEDEGKCTEIVMHENLIGLAAKIYSGKVFANAARLGSLMDKMHSDEAGEKESLLMNLILGTGKEN